jgi:hypothetical protein
MIIFCLSEATYPSDAQSKSRFYLQKTKQLNRYLQSTQTIHPFITEETPAR